MADCAWMYPDNTTARTIIAAQRHQADTVINRLSVVAGKQIQEDTRLLLNKLTEGAEDIMVFAVVGVCGIGKTALAKMVYNNEAIKDNFDIKMWVSVTKEFNTVDLLAQAIGHATGEFQKVWAEDKKPLLGEALHRIMKGNKCFLVLDDMWSAEEWSSLFQPPFSDCAAGSRVLITTRHSHVAKGMQASEPYHKVAKLKADDAWLLLKKQVIRSDIDQTEIDMLKDIGMKLIKKCDGLPLAVKATGAVLCKKGVDRRKWEEALTEPVWSAFNIPEGLNYAMSLSYEDLPPCLKLCFLHYSFLPKSMKLSVHGIVGMWISEGFIVGKPDDLERLGHDCFDELISRNLIEPDPQYLGHDVCHMHDVVRTFAQYVVRDEALVSHSGEENLTHQLNSQEFLRLSVETRESKAGVFEWSKLKTLKSLRTLILFGRFNILPGDSLTGFPSLRALHVESSDVDKLFDSLSVLKLLRYLSIEDTDISELPEDIGMLKFLRHISLYGNRKLAKLPGSIVKLEQLRYLGLNKTCVGIIPKGFRGLINLKILYGFPAHMDGDWCSLEELGPLLQLRILGLNGLENVSATSFAAKAKLHEKKDLNTLFLQCCEASVEKQGQKIEEVYDELRPPPCLENLVLNGYFGLRLPRWMMSETAMVSLRGLRTLSIKFLSNCTQLPNGLCQLPDLEFLLVYQAEGIRLVGPEFLKLYYPSEGKAAFPKLKKLILQKMPRWQKWEWEEKVQAMPVLEELELTDCGLTCVPPGLISHAKALKVLHVDNTKLNFLDNFASVVELTVSNNHSLVSITNFPKLQKLTVEVCLKMKVLKGVPRLQRFVLDARSMETLPEYIQDVKSSQLLLFCDLVVLTSIAVGQTGPEWKKFEHLAHVKAYTRANAYTTDNRVERREWYVSYTRDPYNLKTNISHSLITGTLSPFVYNGIEDFKSVFKMTRSTFNYICSMVKRWSLKDIVVSRNYTFLDESQLSLVDEVAVALIRLNSADSSKIIGYTISVSELTIEEVTWSFVLAIKYGASRYHGHWPDSTEMKNIKSRFELVHGLPNCCGVVDAIPIGACLSSTEQNCNHENNDNIVLQAVIDSDMRFMDISVAWSDSMNKSIISQYSNYFKVCKEGPDGPEVGEYIIGDAEYPLLCWLLTPYHEKNLQDTKVEFNRRHSSARKVAHMALARFKDTWRIMDGLHMDKSRQLCMMIHVCCVLHNIVVNREGSTMERISTESGGGTDEQDPYATRPLRRCVGFRSRQPDDEDAVSVRDKVSEHMTSSSSGGDTEEQDPHATTGRLRRSTAFGPRQRDKDAVHMTGSSSPGEDANKGDARKDTTITPNAAQVSPRSFTVPPGAAMLWPIPPHLLHTCPFSKHTHPLNSCPFWKFTLGDGDDGTDDG